MNKKIRYFNGSFVIQRCPNCWLLCSFYEQLGTFLMENKKIADGEKVYWDFIREKIVNGNCSFCRFN